MRPERNDRFFPLNASGYSKWPTFFRLFRVRVKSFRYV